MDAKTSKNNTTHYGCCNGNSPSVQLPANCANAWCFAHTCILTTNLTQTIVPTSLQLITMAIQMVTINPMLSLLAATVAKSTVHIVVS
jgi:hypothetical protein